MIPQENISFRLSGEKQPEPRHAMATYAMAKTRSDRVMNRQYLAVLNGGQGRERQRLRRIQAGHASSTRGIGGNDPTHIGFPEA